MCFYYNVDLKKDKVFFKKAKMFDGYLSKPT